MARHCKDAYYTPWQKTALVFVPVIAFGGMWWHELGLLLLPIMATLLVFGFRNGKYWCGRLCPHGSLFDFILWRYSREDKSTLQFLRSPWVQGGFLAFYMIMFIRRILHVLPLFGTMAFWDRLGFLMAVNYLMPTLVGSALALLVRRRAWCSICTMGSMQKLSYRLCGLLRLNTMTDHRVTMIKPEACRSCRLCERACPMGIVLPISGQLDSPECIKCESCILACPVGALAMRTIEGAGESPAAAAAHSLN